MAATPQTPRADPRSNALATLVCAAIGLGCGAGVHRRPAFTPLPAGPVLVLYRDHALISSPGQPGRTIDQLTWRIHYRLILEGAGQPGRGTLYATLELTNHGDDAIDAVVLPVADSAFPAPASDATPASRRANVVASQPVASQPVALLPRRTTLVQLFRARGVPVDTAVHPFYDEAATNALFQSPTPVLHRAHGLRGADIAHPEVRHALRIELAGAGISALPEGPMTVFRRQPDGELALLGTDPEFTARPWLGSAHAVLGPAPGMRVTRRQTDYALDLHARRLLEEIRLEFDNQSEHDRVIVAHEHMYRGLNWSIAYHNEAGVPQKIGPQTIRFDIPVRAHASAMVVYRVVYNWDANAP